VFLQIKRVIERLDLVIIAGVTLGVVLLFPPLRSVLLTLTNCASANGHRAGHPGWADGGGDRHPLPLNLSAVIQHSVTVAARRPVAGAKPGCHRTQTPSLDLTHE
jgi:hypothetical protein